MTTLFALVDCNNFYVSCERVFNPGLEHRPVVVLSNNDGCIISRSNEVKALGIGMGKAAFEVRDILSRHQVEVFSSNYTLYADMSGRVMQTLANFTPAMEVYSIDEAFLDLSGIDHPPEDYGRQIQHTVRQWTGIPVSIGIAPTKTLAKLANKIAKKSPKTAGVLNLADSPFLAQALQRVSVQELPALKLGGPREAVHVRFRVGAFDGDYVVAHLKSGGSHNERETREGECRALSAWLHNPNGPSAPTDADVLIGGDLNTEANETALQILLNDPWLVWCFAGLAQPPVTRPCSGRTIDHIFMTSDCRPNLRRTTVFRAPYDALGADEYRRLVSDHLPVVVSLYTDEDPDG